MLRIAKSSQELRLSFNFKIINKIERTLFINANGLLRPIMWNQKSFEWFLEDLVYYIKQYKYQQRWDISNIEVSNCKTLKLTKKNFLDLQSFATQVIQWKVILIF